MTDYLTALEATWRIWAFIALCAAVAGLFIYADYRGDKIRAAREEENRRTKAHIGICGHPFGDLSCDRALNHDGLHGDRHTRPREQPVTWRDDELGMRSLDEIRRAVGGDSDAA